jgi:hypothetical protein
MEVIAQTGQLFAEKAELEERNEKAQENNADLESVSQIHTYICTCTYIYTFMFMQ